VIIPVVVGGTAESFVNDLRTTVPVGTMCEFTTRHLDPLFFGTPRWVGYPAAYGSTMDYEESVAIGIAELWEIVQVYIGEGEQVVLVGYSQGAAIIRRFLAKLAAGGYGDPSVFKDVIVGAALIADPYRPPGGTHLLDTIPPGYGVAGAREIWPDGYLVEVAAPRDPICASPYNSYIRTIADFSGFFSFEPRDLIMWAKQTIIKIQEQGWQNANLDWTQFWQTGQRVREAVDGIGGYLPYDKNLNPGGGRHTCYGTEKMPMSQFTYCERLAIEMNTIARRSA
jgi:pimeloyl-ACP methyl ester carboxylesterase